MADEKYTKGRLYNETMEKMLLILMCAGAMSGLTGCGNNTNNTDDNAVNEVKDGVEDGVDDIVEIWIRTIRKKTIQEKMIQEKMIRIIPDRKKDT